MLLKKPTLVAAGYLMLVAALLVRRTRAPIPLLLLRRG
jgi:hypothetical protein